MELLYAPTPVKRSAERLA